MLKRILLTRQSPNDKSFLNWRRRGLLLSAGAWSTPTWFGDSVTYARYFDKLFNFCIYCVLGSNIFLGWKIFEKMADLKNLPINKMDMILNDNVTELVWFNNIAHTQCF